jgi:hypothetical protein
MPTGLVTNYDAAERGHIVVAKRLKRESPDKPNAWGRR